MALNGLRKDTELLQMSEKDVQPIHHRKTDRDLLASVLVEAFSHDTALEQIGTPDRHHEPVAPPKCEAPDHFHCPI